MNNFTQVAEMLAQHTEDVARFLLPNGKKEGQEWCVGNVDGEAGKSLKIHLTGDKSGVWCDFAIGIGGDLIDLWSLSRKISLRDALLEAQRYLGIKTPKFEAHKLKSFAIPSVTSVRSLVTGSPVMNYLIRDRKLTLETIHAFKIGEQDRKIIFPYWRNDKLISVFLLLMWYIFALTLIRKAKLQ